MRNDAFSRAILSGLRARGMSSAEISTATGLSARELESVEHGANELALGTLSRIEQATGMSCGQLAALAAEPNGGPLTDLYNATAAGRTWYAPAVARPVKQRR